MSYQWDRVFGGYRGGLLRWKHKTTCGLNATGHSTCTCGGPTYSPSPFGALIRDVKHREGADPGGR